MAPWRGEVDVFATNTFVSDGDAVSQGQISGCWHKHVAPVVAAKIRLLQRQRVNMSTTTSYLRTFMAVQVHSWRLDKHNVNDEATSS